ncbi:MAG: helix-turn-helix transcriptional regulator [Clostridia bacterium]|nr:helix-turn-helix transcriptional regulator [Clostridia bacterium]
MINFEINKRLATDYIQDKRMLSVKKSTITNNVAFHAHDFFEIELVLSGEGTQILNGKEYEMKKGTLYLVTPLDYHQITVTKAPIDLYSIKLYENFLPYNLLNIILNSQSNIFFDDNITLYDKALNLCNLLYEEYTRSSPEPKYIANIVECIFILLARNFTTLTDIKSSGYNPIQSAVIYMKLHFQEDPPVQKAAEICYLSTNYFSSMFRKYMGKTYSEYLTELKLDYAKKLLLTTDLSITDICFSSGFSSVSNFLKAFKQKINISPNKFRKENHNM